MNTIPADEKPAIRFDENLEWMQQLLAQVGHALHQARVFDFYPRAEVGETSNVVDVRVHGAGISGGTGLQVRYTASPEHESRVIISISEAKIFMEARCISGERRHEEYCSFDWQHTGMKNSIERAVGVMMEFFRDPIHKDPQRQ